MKNYILVAGINGAGKSTLYRSEKDWFLDTRANRVNADEELRKLGGNSDSKIDQAAGARVAVTKMRDFLEAGQSFHQETTLSGRSDIVRIRKAKSLGYKVILLYVALDSAELAKKRVANRVANGGHNIPGSDIDRRYGKSFANLAKIAGTVDEIHVFENSAGTMEEIYWRESDKVFLDELARFPWIPELN